MDNSADNSSVEIDKRSSEQCSRVLIVTPSSETAMHVSGGVGKVYTFIKIN